MVTTKLRLYALRRAGEREHLPAPFFADQKLAKIERDRLTQVTGIEHQLCAGPDHKRYSNYIREIA